MKIGENHMKIASTWSRKWTNLR